MFKDWRRNRRIKKVAKNYEAMRLEEKTTIRNHAHRLLEALEAGNIGAIRFYANYFDKKGIALPNSLQELRQFLKDVE